MEEMKKDLQEIQEEMKEQTPKKAKKNKRKMGDRRDGKRLKNIDSMHAFMPYLLPKRTDSEAVLSENIDATKLLQYVAEKNAQGPSFKYTVFHCVLAALAKTIYLRPKMNYFYKGHRLYERNDIIFAFTAKRTFEDHSEEALAKIKLDKESELSPIEQMHSKVEKFVTMVRKHNQTDGATDIIGTLCKFPRFIVRTVVGLLNWMDYHGIMPEGLANEDPYNSTVFVSNLGSIKATANYHHLTEWGTNSIFVIVGEMKYMQDIDKEGNASIKKMMPVGFTIDERIADGFYFAKSFKIFRHLIENPELLDRPLQEPIDFTV
ncbi:MAG: 2-oxo acid dehydrogenase subunit E2 [Clostridia bacterium]|nr:2-oxo acid dehydrogenase subunit E2 [Clostridia bacterium]